MTGVALFGSLRDDALRAIVLGRAVPGIAATLPGLAALRVSGGDWAGLRDDPAASAEALLLRAATADDLARLAHYLSGFGLSPGVAPAVSAIGAAPAQVWRPEAGAVSNTAWTLADWQAQWGPLARRAAGEAMELMTTADGADLRAAMPNIRARAASYLRARAQSRPPRGAVDVRARRRPYTRFFALTEEDLTHPLHAGGRSAVLRRAAFVSGDAVTVLPYDPVRDAVLVVEQFRYGAFARGSADPWCVEPAAGRIDAGESPEAAARRELREETGLEAGRLLAVAEYYPSPGACSEYLYSYVALCDLPEDAGGIGGLADEGEDIRAIRLSFAALMDRLADGRADNGPLILTALWLAERRDGLRAGRSAGGARSLDAGPDDA